MISHPVSRLGNYSGDPPRWIVRAWTYLQALVRRLRTPKELRDAEFSLWVENLNKCRDCFFLDTAAKHPTCDICGCNVELKTRWMSEKCPIDEWDNTLHLKTRLAELATRARLASPPTDKLET